VEEEEVVVEVEEEVVEEVEEVVEEEKETSKGFVSAVVAVPAIAPARI